MYHAHQAESNFFLYAIRVCTYRMKIKKKNRRKKSRVRLSTVHLNEWTSIHLQGFVRSTIFYFIFYPLIFLFQYLSVYTRGKDFFLLILNFSFFLFFIFIFLLFVLYYLCRCCVYEVYVVFIFFFFIIILLPWYTRRTQKFYSF